mmetsp:Transcript_52160/g.82821  ORF Transcript_52160/g.82821 Transcript_52160/m.82821 type:complete len:418 (+) Transcript_52160:63-1316(+)|eukprot:CAMPEP_0169095984 /NCGR_PEP_ID=MMETSP1015-20121227/18761_1 /TAXON_ID=342587 /ORGANISM="Karlodinium micrum, Strain CCMP2283" /LENGTH=417 /DNA_ID=CAMNT_0009156727 /DNA_START=56 /DNA_END=1309 /DNA_ORIENTATION=-
MPRWSKERTWALGSTPPTDPRVMVLPSEQFNSVDAAIKALEAGQIPCSGYCAVLSRRTGAYYILWPQELPPPPEVKAVPSVQPAPVPVPAPVSVPDVLQAFSVNSQRSVAPAATVGIDTSGDGRANIYVTGVDRNRDGIPDALQAPQAPQAFAIGSRVKAKSDIRKAAGTLVIVRAGTAGNVASLPDANGLVTVQWDQRLDGSSHPLFQPQHFLEEQASYQPAPGRPFSLLPQPQPQPQVMPQAPAAPSFVPPAYAFPQPAVPPPVEYYTYPQPAVAPPVEFYTFPPPVVNTYEPPAIEYVMDPRLLPAPMFNLDGTPTYYAVPPAPAPGPTGVETVAPAVTPGVQVFEGQPMKIESVPLQTAPSMLAYQQMLTPAPAVAPGASPTLAAPAGAPTDQTAAPKKKKASAKKKQKKGCC